MANPEYADFFAPGAPSPMAGEAGKLSRKQKLVDMLTNQALSTLTPFRGGFGAESPLSPFQVAAQLAKAYFAKKGGDDLVGEQNALATKYNEGARQAIGDYIDMAQGRPGVPGVEASPARGPIEGMASPSASTAEVPAQPAIAPDPRRATVEAFASPYEPVQRVAQMMLANQLKNSLSKKDILSLPSDISAESKIAAANTGDTSGLTAKPTLTTVGNQIVDTSKPNAPKSIYDATTQFEKTPAGLPAITWQKGADGQLEPYQREVGSGRLHKLDNATKITLKNIGNAGNDAGAKEIFKLGAETVGKLGEQARAAIHVKNTMIQMQALDQNGVFTNVTSGMKTLATNISQALGANLSPKQINELANTETFNSIGIDAWQRLVNQFGGNRGVTAQEAEQIKQIVPSLQSSPQARAQLYKILSDSAERQVGQFHMANEAFAIALKQNDASLWQKQFANIFAPISTNPPVQPSPTKGPPPFTFTPKGR